MALKKALFLHTQKTAGTSVTELAWANYGHGNVMSHDDFLRFDDDAIDRTPFLSGHFGFGFARERMAQRYAFTFLREPVERLLSLYSFCRGQTTDAYPIYAAARSLPLDKFLVAWQQLTGIEKIIYRETIWNHQAWQLCFGWMRDVYNPDRVTAFHFSEAALLTNAQVNLLRFDHVGFTESFDMDLATIAKELGLTVGERSPRANATERRVRLDELPASTVGLLRSFTELDNELYAKALAMRRSSFPSTQPDHPSSAK